MDLRGAGRPARVAARDEPAVGVERDAPTGAGLPRFDELLRLALATESEQLVGLERLVDERVVAEREAHVLGADACSLVALARGVARHRGRPHDRTHERVTACIRLGLQRGSERSYHRTTGLPLA